MSSKKQHRCPFIFLGLRRVKYLITLLAFYSVNLTNGWLISRDLSVPRRLKRREATPQGDYRLSTVLGLHIQTSTPSSDFGENNTHRYKKLIKNIDKTISKGIKSLHTMWVLELKIFFCSFGDDRNLHKKQGLYINHELFGDYNKVEK